MPGVFELTPVDTIDTQANESGWGAESRGRQEPDNRNGMSTSPSKVEPGETGLADTKLPVGRADQVPTTLLEALLRSKPKSLDQALESTQTDLRCLMEVAPLESTSPSVVKIAMAT